MTTKFTQAQVQAIVAQAIGLALATAQQGAAQATAPKATSAPKVRKQGRKQPTKAQQAAREAKQAAGLAKVRGIAEAKATKGKVQLTQPEHLHIARVLCEVPIPQDATRFTLSIGDKGWAFVGKAMQEVPVTPAQAAELRSVFDALVVRKDAQA